MSKYNDAIAIYAEFAYPIDINISVLNDGLGSVFNIYLLRKCDSLFNFSEPVQLVVNHSYIRDLLLPTGVRSKIEEHQLASKIFFFFCYFYIGQTLNFFLRIGGFMGNVENGTVNSLNTLTYSDEAGNTFNRVVNAYFGKITSDHRSGSLASPASPAAAEVSQSMVSLLGNLNVRLPGGRKMALK